VNADWWELSKGDRVEVFLGGAWAVPDGWYAGTVRQLAYNMFEGPHGRARLAAGERSDRERWCEEYLDTAAKARRRRVERNASQR
jgi:hypothetical protein